MLTVIIPNRNSPIIDQTLWAICQQNFALATVEVLVVGVDDLNLVKGDHLVHKLTTSASASAATNRNAGIAAARGELICFTDADCLPDVDWLERIVTHFEDPKMQVLGGGVRFGDVAYWAKVDHHSWFYQFLTTAAPGERAHLPTLNLALRRSVIDNVGKMDESFVSAAGEDTEWTERMRQRGYTLHFDPAVTVVHAAQRHTGQDVWRHGYRYGWNSPKIRQGKNGHYRIIPQQWWILLIIAPLLALLAALQVLIKGEGRKILWLLPGIWLSKLAWCFGASQALKHNVASTK